MVPVGLRRGRYKGWDSWHVSKGPLELVLVPQVGGRIMGLCWRDHDLFFTDPALEGQVDDLAHIEDLAATKRERSFRLWGGDKTWLAPQDRWTEAVPFLDLDSGPYDLAVEHERAESVRVRMTSRRCRETGVQISRTVEVRAERPGWTVTHALLNASADEVEWAPWDVAMLLRPGKVYLPRNDASSHRDGVKTFESEGDSVSARPRVVSELGRLAVVDCTGEVEFKFGVDASEGWMLGIIEANDGRLVGYLKSVPVFDGRSYGHGCLSEVYNSHRFRYFEMEVHGPVTLLQPGEPFELVETQRLFAVPAWPTSEAQVRALLDPTAD